MVRTTPNRRIEFGESYLVFSVGPEIRLTTNSCAGNRPLKLADELFQVLGRGEKPKEAVQNPERKPGS